MLSSVNLFNRIDVPQSNWLRCRSFEFYLPTEVVVREPQIVVPRVGRYYELDLYVRGDRLLTYEELRELPDFQGTTKEIVVFLYEIWDNDGDDGHTEFRLRCWMLHPGKYSGDPCNMYNEFYDRFRQG